MSKKFFQLIFLFLSFLALFACSTGRRGFSGGGVTDSYVPPSSFDNPFIKYDTEDPTSKVGDITYTADPAVMVVDDTVYLYATHDESIGHQ